MGSEPSLSTRKAPHLVMYLYKQHSRRGIKEGYSDVRDSSQHKSLDVQRRATRQRCAASPVVLSSRALGTGGGAPRETSFFTFCSLIAQLIANHP